MYAIFHVRKKNYLRDSVQECDRVGLIERPEAVSQKITKQISNTIITQQVKQQTYNH